MKSAQVPYTLFLEAHHHHKAGYYPIISKLMHHVLFAESSYT